MHRRGFLAGAAAIGAAVPAIAHAGAKGGDGQLVSLKGRLRRVAGHYFVLDTQSDRTDPASRSYSDWPQTCIRVYPQDAARMADGQVTVRGRLYFGKQQDAHTGKVATLTMADAVIA